MSEEIKFKSRFQGTQHLFRKLHLLSAVEYIDYVLVSLKCSMRNSAFVRQNPGFKIPPHHLAYDAYSAPDWWAYKTSGEESAAYLSDIFLKYKAGEPIGSVLEWGCGPARIIRHLPRVLGETATIYGCDYNHETIEWCKKNITGVHFTTNGINPPVQLDSSTFDFIYAISVLTHLSQSTGMNWIEELYRLLKPDGILLITLKGDSYYHRLLPKEQTLYDSLGIVVRGNMKEGRKMFAAFHNPKYVRETLLASFEVLQHVPLGSLLTSQDTWIARKTRN